MRYNLVEPFSGNSVNDATLSIEWWWLFVCFIITVVIFIGAALFIYCLCLFLKTRTKELNQRPIFKIKTGRKYTDHAIPMKTFNNKSLSATIYQSINDAETVYNFL